MKMKKIKHGERKETQKLHTILMSQIETLKTLKTFHCLLENELMQKESQTTAKFYMILHHKKK